MILVDTGPLVALCDTHDRHHARALSEVDRVARDRLVVASAVLTEACFLLPSPALGQRLRSLVTRLEIGGVPGEGTDPFREDVFTWLARYAEHDPDFADACLAVASGREGAAAVWTFDAEFTTTWRRLDGTKIPVVAAAPSRRRPRPAR